MMMKSIAPIALSLILVLGAASASADRRSHEKPEKPIEALALRLDHATSDLYREAVERGHYHGWRERRAVHALRHLERRADVFSAIVVRHGADGRRADRAFDELERAYEVATAKRGALRRSHRLRHEFARVNRLMENTDQRIAQLDRRRDHRHHARNGWDVGHRYAYGRRAIVAFHFGD